MVICFDIGGTAIKAAVARTPDGLVGLGARPTPVADFDAFCSTLAGLIVGAGSPPSVLSIAVTGVVDPDSGRIKCANIPCIDGRRLAADLEAALQHPVVVTNDADCFAIAEAAIGAGVGHHVVFGVILGTGVGGGIVVDGRLVCGAGGFAGEWGHGTIVARQAGNPPTDIPWFACGCGRHGCLDTVGGARGLERLHAFLNGRHRSSEEIVMLWHEGDATAERTIECYVELVAQPLAYCVNMIGADIVPAGGGLARDHGLIERLDRAVRERILWQADRPLVVAGRCKDNPGLVGAAFAGGGEVR